jgi:hypothetical protein
MVPAGVSYTAAGAIIPNVKVENVFYGSAWTSTSDANNPELRQQATDLNAFITDITKSSYMSGLSQYSGVYYNQLNLGTYHLAMPYGGAPGTGQFVGSDYVKGGSLNTNGNLDEATIVATFKQEIANGKLKAPDANTLYMVYLAPGEKSQFDVSAADGGGHHAVFATANGPAYYAIVDSPIDNFFKPTNMPATATNFQKLTAITSHEMVEALTNPADWDKVDSASSSANKPAWTDSAGNEIGDIAQNSPPAGGVMSMVDGFMVQKYWSNKDKTSVAPGGTDYKTMTAIPTELTGAHFTLTALQTGAKATAQLQITYITLGTKAGTATFSGLYQDVNGLKEVISGTLTVNGQSLSITATDTASKTVFTGTVSAPLGNWRSGVELRGTSAIGGYTMFGVEDGGSIVLDPSGPPSYGGLGDGAQYPPIPSVNHKHNIM